MLYIFIINLSSINNIFNHLLTIAWDNELFNNETKLTIKQLPNSSQTDNTNSNHRNSVL